jgi:hypothetical protein
MLCATGQTAIPPFQIDSVTIEQLQVPATPDIPGLCTGFTAADVWAKNRLASVIGQLPTMTPRMVKRCHRRPLVADCGNLRCQPRIGPQRPGEFHRHVFQSAAAGYPRRRLDASGIERDRGRQGQECRDGILIDRAIALVALVGMVIAALPWLTAHLPDTRMVWATAVLAVSAMLGFLVFIWLIPRLPARWRRWTLVAFVIDLGIAAAATVREGRRTVAILFLAVAGNLPYGVVLLLCPDGLGIGLDAVAALILMMPALFAMAVPISVAGWGVREGILVVGLGQLGCRRQMRSPCRSSGESSTC